MDTLLAKYAMLLPSKTMDMNLMDILYAFNIFSCLNYFQMRLGTAFGAFLDPVADKVNALFLNMACIVIYWFALVECVRGFSGLARENKDSTM